MKDFPFEYVFLLKFEYFHGVITVKDFVFPKQRVSRSSFEVLDLSYVKEGYEGTLHKHHSYPNFSPKDRGLLLAYPLNLLAVGEEVVKASWRGKVYRVEERARDDVGKGGVEEGETRR